jgi:hypothetical protein
MAKLWKSGAETLDGGWYVEGMVGPVLADVGRGFGKLPEATDAERSAERFGRGRSWRGWSDDGVVNK